MIVICVLESQWHLFTMNTKIALFGELAIKSGIAIVLSGILFLVLHKFQKDTGKQDLL